MRLYHTATLSEAGNTASFNANHGIVREFVADSSYCGSNELRTDAPSGLHSATFKSATGEDPAGHDATALHFCHTDIDAIKVQCVINNGRSKTWEEEHKRTKNFRIISPSDGDEDAADLHIFSYETLSFCLRNTHTYHTTSNGYPILLAPLSYDDTRTDEFLEHYRKAYTEKSMKDLRRLCAKKALVVYGRREQVAERLVERALRDARRGWSEGREFFGKMSVGEPPRLPWG